MPRRTWFSFDVFCSCCVATCIRRPNCSLSSASSSVFNSAPDFLPSAFFESVNFISRSPSTQQALNERRLNRQLGGRERERLPRQRLVNSVHFVEHLARLDLGDVILRIAFAVTHAHFRRFL